MNPLTVVCLVACRLDLTENVVRYVPIACSKPRQRKKKIHIVATKATNLPLHFSFLCNFELMGKPS